MYIAAASLRSKVSVQAVPSGPAPGAFDSESARLLEIPQDNVQRRNRAGQMLLGAARVRTSYRGGHE